MAAESSKRSKLIDMYVLYTRRCVVSYFQYRTYQRLHQLLSGYETRRTPDQIDEVLQTRIDVLKNLREPFGKPYAESRKCVDNGSIRLHNGIHVQAEQVDKDFIFVISARFNFDLFCTTKEMYFRSSSQMVTTLLCNGSSMRFHYFIMQSGDALHVSLSLLFVRA